MVLRPLIQRYCEIKTLVYCIGTNCRRMGSILHALVGYRCLVLGIIVVPYPNREKHYLDKKDALIPFQKGISLRSDSHAIKNLSSDT